GLRILEEELILTGLRDAHHLDPVPVRPGRFEAPTDCVLTRPQHLGEALIDDCDGARVLVVDAPEAPPANDLNPHRLEVSGADDVPPRGPAVVAVDRLPLRLDCRGRPDVTHRNRKREA